MKYEADSLGWPKVKYKKATLLRMRIRAEHQLQRVWLNKKDFYWQGRSALQHYDDVLKRQLP